LPTIPTVSVVVPVAGDQEAAEQLLAQIPPDPRVEVILADGGGNPLLEAMTRARQDVRVVRSARGRARQMNSGAAVAHGEWLIFVHADSTLPNGWLDVFLREASRTEGAIASGGWFQFALDDPSWQARLIERGVRWRVRLFRLPYGDQGLFVRRHIFNTLGGYRELPLMEDVEFARRFIAAGPVIELPVALATSARRWRADGWFRRSLLNMGLVLLYFAGVNPQRLARWYGGGRPAAPSRSS
jgi:rSAM/selenodomain-associated transferase 2